MADGIGRASALLASGTLVSRILGFVKAIVLAQTIGVVGSVSGDAFATANQLPNNIYVIIGGGVLSAVLVPQIVRASIHPDGGHGYINKLLTITLVFVGGATVVATALAPVFVAIYATKASPDELALATAFAYWCLPQILFYGLYTVLGEILNAKKMFGPFTWAPVLNNVVAIAGLIVFVVVFGSDPNGHRSTEDWTGSMIALLGGSATLGVLAQALILFVFWRRVGLRFKPDFKWRGVGLRATAKIASWTFGMLILTQLAGLVETNVAWLAAGQGPGVFALQNAWLIFMLPHSIITVSIATAYFTRMSEHGQGADGKKPDLGRLRGDVSAAIRVVSLLIVLATAVLIVVSYPFSSFFTETFDQTAQLGNVVIGYLVGLVPFCILFIVQRAFYALADTKTPFFFTLFQVILVSVAALLVGALVPPPFIGLGIALAISLSGIAQTILAGWLLRNRLGGLELRRIFPSLLRYAVAAVPAAAVGWFVLVPLGGATDGFGTSSYVGAAVTMLVVGAVMAAVYIALLAAFRAPELKAAIEPIRARLGR